MNTKFIDPSRDIPLDIPCSHCPEPLSHIVLGHPPDIKVLTISAYIYANDIAKQKEKLEAEQNEEEPQTEEKQEQAITVIDNHLEEQEETLNDLTSKELKKIAKDRGLTKYSKLTKNNIIKLIIEDIATKPITGDNSQE